MALLPSRSLLHAPACLAPKQKITFGSRYPLIAPEPNSVIVDSYAASRSTRPEWLHTVTSNSPQAVAA
jgi:hypothetical protein